MALKLLKLLIAILLLPFVAAEAWTLFDLARLSVPAGQWRQAWFVCLAAGFAVWTIIFLLLPRTLWLYVLGHEFTHALAAILSGGRVSGFKVSSRGGHVLTDRVSWWISLSPYFVPIYALFWIGLWLTVDLYHPLRHWQPVLYFGIGFFWAFHVTFTISMLHREQTDLSREGFVFSGAIIALLNLLAVLLLLSLLGHHFSAMWHLLWRHSGQAYAATGRGFVHGWEWLRGWDSNTRT